MRIVDVANPSAPIEVGFLNTAGTLEDVTISDIYALFSDESRKLILQCDPSFFNSSTTLRYHLPQTCNVTVMIYSLSGAVVAEMNPGLQDKGRHEIVFDGKNLEPGGYIFAITGADQTGSIVRKGVCKAIKQ